MIEIDPDTGFFHINPVGMNHGKRYDGKFYTGIKMRDFIIVEHQKHYPQLLEQMRKAKYRNAANYYAYFLATVPLQLKGMLTDELKTKIQKAFNLL